MFDAKIYSERIASILAAGENGDRLMPLAPSEPLSGEGLELLRVSSESDLLAGAEIAAEDFAECVRSALFLYFSDLDASHTISQDIPTATGSYLHGILHRQEPDASNAKYWFRRVGVHEVFPSLRGGALKLLASAASPKAERLRLQIDSRPQWDPFWFVDQCETARAGSDAEMVRLLQQIQRLEWQLLFDYSYRKATGLD